MRGRSRKLIAIVGEREVGKTTQVLDIISRRNERTIVNDHSRQPAYYHLGEIGLDKVALQTKGVYRTYDSDYKRFFRILYNDWGIKTKMIGGLAIVEDASAAFGMQKDEDLFSMFVGLRHRNVDLVLVFHTIRDTPKYIIGQLNDFVMLRTADAWTNDLQDRFPSRVQEEAKQKFDIVQNHTNKFHFEKISIIQTGSK